jgi:molybdopterin-binding protein
VTKGATTSHVRIEIGQGVIITASITNEAVTDPGLQKGDEARAIIKASDVTIGKSTMKLSARNQLKGKIIEVTKGATTSHVRIEIGQGLIIMSSITNEAVADLGLQKGDEAWAVIKASDVMIGK